MCVKGRGVVKGGVLIDGVDGACAAPKDFDRQGPVDPVLISNSD